MSSATGATAWRTNPAIQKKRTFENLDHALVWSCIKVHHDESEWPFIFKKIKKNYKNKTLTNIMVTRLKWPVFEWPKWGSLTRLRVCHDVHKLHGGVELRVFTLREFKPTPHARLDHRHKKTPHFCVVSMEKKENIHDLSRRITVVFVHRVNVYLFSQHLSEWVKQKLNFYHLFNDQKKKWDVDRLLMESSIKLNMLEWWTFTQSCNFAKHAGKNVSNYLKEIKACAHQIH